MTTTLPRRPTRARRVPDPGPAWWRAPTQLLRSPTLAVGLAAAVALLALAGAARPLFVTLAGDAALAEELEAFDVDGLGATVSMLSSLDSRPLALASDALDTAGAELGLGSPLVQIEPTEAGQTQHPETGEPVEVNYPFGFPTDSTQLYGSSHALEHLPERDGGGDGLWFPRRVAEAAGLEPGDEVAFVMRGQGTTVRVAGTYRDLAEVVPVRNFAPDDALPDDHPVVEFWRPRSRLVTQFTGDGTPTPAPPLIVGEPEDVAALGTSTFRPPTNLAFTFRYPRDDTAVHEATAVLERYTALEDQAVNRTLPLGAALREASDVPGGQVTFHTLLDGAVERPTTLVATLEGSLAPGVYGGIGLALAAIAGVALAAARRHRAEHSLLAVQGTGGLWVTGRAALEAALPAVVGAVAGAGAAVALATGLGPGGRPHPEMLGDVGAAALAAGVAGMGVWVVVALATRIGGDRRGGLPRLVARMPWVVLLLAATLAGAVVLAGREGGLLVGEGDARRLDLLAVGFPVLLVATAAGLAGRALQPIGRLLRDRGRALPAPLYLAARAVGAGSTAARTAVVCLVVGSGLLAFAVVAAQSVGDTVVAKAAAEGGAETAMTMSPRDPVPDLGAAHTEVLRTSGSLEPQGVEAEVLAVDPATFAQASAWTDAFADEPLPALLEELQAPGPALPAIVAGSVGAVPQRLRTDRYDLPIDVVARLPAFPGMAGASRVLVVDAERLIAAADAAGTSIDEELVLLRRREVWVAGGAPIREQLRTGMYLGAQRERGTGDILQRPDLLAAQWTLDYLRAVGVAAGVLALVGLLAYGAGRQRRRMAGLALARRMGLSNRAAAGALAAELGGLALVGVAAGTLAGTGAAWAVVAALDPLPGAPPAAFLSMPVLPLTLAAAGIVTAAVVGALVAARRRDPKVGALLRG